MINIIITGIILAVSNILCVVVGDIQFETFYEDPPGCASKEPVTEICFFTSKNPSGSPNITRGTLYFPSNTGGSKEKFTLIRDILYEDDKVVDIKTSYSGSARRSYKLRPLLSDDEFELDYHFELIQVEEKPVCRVNANAKTTYKNGDHSFTFDVYLPDYPSQFRFETYYREHVYFGENERMEYACQYKLVLYNDAKDNNLWIVNYESDPYFQYAPDVSNGDTDRDAARGDFGSRTLYFISQDGGSRVVGHGWEF